MKRFKSITMWLFCTTQIAALMWVTFSYLIAGYSTVFLGAPFPIESLSEKAIEVILGVSVLKVLENIFEHNDGVIFGVSNTNKERTRTGKTKRDC